MRVEAAAAVTIVADQAAMAEVARAVQVVAQAEQAVGL